MNIHVPALQRSLPDVVAEYDHKRAGIAAALAAFNAAGDELKMAATVGGSFGNTQIDTGHIYDSTLETSLLKSAWRHVYDGLNIATIASAADKRRFEQAMEKPAPFTLDNIRATFGRFVADPRGNILRGLAEVFCDLDQAYKSHDKVKIGVAGLPKRIILTNVSNYGSWGRDRLQNVLNAIAAYQGKPLVTWPELSALLDDGDALLTTRVIEKPRRYGEPERIPVIARGVRLKRFANGNGHLHFEPDTLRDINRALAEYYGDVLPDTTDERPARPRAGTAVAKDLQYYPTPRSVVDRVLDDLHGLKGARVLEPSCGCGRFLDGLRQRGAAVLGIEVDAGRAAQSRAKGHSVVLANFLETVPTGDFDRVVMNSPFYGKHYAKHVEHARKFLKPGGTLTAILPATARYDHGLFPDGRWSDLPVGSFSESGTNINTTILTLGAIIR
ncbi:SAM-dependent methyltransferase [Bradyrhizobium pachyrhizi]|uniref:DUF4942 domain-containing protein n=1 Tax=Bradyrhizobium pachyrhizi TaxID=280333 RepID=UPI0007049074|nr:DUF4942 domain-containing protein [Bradyrhizobium pachyrhizi]KRQ11893.1 SAM-dependent methyltransferase [Bradyrhizobium pachyrhizi]